METPPEELNPFAVYRQILQAAQDQNWPVEKTVKVLVEASARDLPDMVRTAQEHTRPKRPL